MLKGLWDNMVEIVFVNQTLQTPGGRVSAVAFSVAEGRCQPLANSGRALDESTGMGGCDVSLV